MLKSDLVQLVKASKALRRTFHRASLSVGPTEENRQEEDQAVVWLEKFLAQERTSRYEGGCVFFESFLVFLAERGIDASTLFTPEYVARLGSSRIFISWISWIESNRINWEKREVVLPQLSQIFTLVLQESLLTFSESIRLCMMVDDRSLQTPNFLQMVQSLNVLRDLNMLDRGMLLKMRCQGLSAWAPVIIALQGRGLGHLLRESCDTAYLRAIEWLERLGVLNESYANAILRRHVAVASRDYLLANRVVGLAKYHNDINDVTIRKPDGTELRATEAVLNILVNDLPGHENIVTAIGILKRYNLLSAEHIKTLLTSSYLEYTTRVLSKMKEFDLLLPADVEKILGHQQYMPALSRKLDAFVKDRSIREDYIEKGRKKIWLVAQSVKIALRRILADLPSAFERKELPQVDDARSAALFSVPAVARSATLFSVPAAAGGASAAAGAASASASPMSFATLAP